MVGKTSGYNYMDKAGEPDGAVWGKGAKTAADVADFTNDDGTVKDLDGLKEVWKDCDFTLDNHLAFYCGTGWRAAVPFLVLYENGYDNISVYDGGWYEWLMHNDYPYRLVILQALTAAYNSWRASDRKSCKIIRY